MSIIDTISTGVAALDKNEALQSLAKILGPKLILGSGDDARLVLLSAYLNPLYIGLLFLILAYIGVAGVVKSATEGRFLGRWSQVGVPGMFMLCIVLLSPVPSQGGATLGQVVFAKALKFGSNSADFILKGVFEVAQEAKVQSDTKASLHRGQLQQINAQMVAALPMFICGEQLKTMGYGTRVDYFVLLKNVCGIPADLHGKYSGFGYSSYYTLSSENGGVKKINDNIKKFEAATGVTLPKQQGYITAAIDAQSQGTISDSSQQLACHFKAFQQVLNGDMAKYASAKIVNKPPIAKPPSGTSVPDKLNYDILEIREDALKVAWPETLYSSYKCLKSTQSLSGKMPESADLKVKEDNQPWSQGWVYAARIIEDDLAAYAQTESASSIPLNPQTTQAVNYRNLGDSLVDKRNIAALTEQQSQVNKIITNVDDGPSTAAQVLGDLFASTISAGVSNVTDADVARVGVGILTTSSLVRAAGEIQGAVGPVNPATMQAKYGKLYGLLNSFIGKAATALPTGLGKATSLVSNGFRVLWNGLNRLLNANTTAKEAAANAPLGIGSVVSLVKGVATTTFGLPNETALSLFVILLTAMNAVVLSPQIILLVVMLLWISRAAVWFMILPIATVLIALPETRVGHDIWKSALGIVLTPVFALIFYLVSLSIFDIAYPAIFYWMIEPLYSAASSGDGWKIVKTLLVQFLGGELFFRVMLGITVAISVTMYMATMILRGPDLVNNALGLRTNSGEIGDDLQGVHHKLNLSQRLSPVNI